MLSTGGIKSEKVSPKSNSIFKEQWKNSPTDTYNSQINRLSDKTDMIKKADHTEDRMRNRERNIPDLISAPSNGKRINMSEVKIENKANVTINYSGPNTGRESILVKHDPLDSTFTFYDRDKIFLGSFKALHLIKYILPQYPDFLGIRTIGGSGDIIRNYICLVDKNENDPYDIKIRLLNQLESPFMGNIEMLLKLYNGISQYQSSIDMEISKLNKADQKYVEYTIKQFIYLLLNHILKIISNISDIIKDDTTKKEMKESLLKYSVGIVYKISNMIKDEVGKKTAEYKILQEDLIKLSKVKINMYDKISKLNDLITEQNTKIDNLVITTPQRGGNNITTTNSTSQMKSTPISTTSHNQTHSTTIISGESDTSTIVSRDGEDRSSTSDAYSVDHEVNDFSLSDIDLTKSYTETRNSELNTSSTSTVVRSKISSSHIKSGYRWTDSGSEINTTDRDSSKDYHKHHRYLSTDSSTS